MKIAVNTRLLIENKLDGIGWFTYEVLKRLTAAHPEHEFIFLFDRPYSKQFVFGPNVTPVVYGPPTRHIALIYFWFEWVLPSKLKKLKADLFFSPDGWVPLRSGIPTVSVIHDLNFETHPEYLPSYIAKYFRYFFPKFAAKASRLATVSNFSKMDIISKYKIPDEKIDVVYNGVNDLFRPTDEKLRTETRNRFSNGAPYFMFVGVLHPRKNIVNLLKAFDSFKKQAGSDHKLLIIGQAKWGTAEMNEVFESLKFKDDVVFTGRLNELDLANVVAAAEAMLYVPFFEGFGIPILEGMASGIPVITSNLTSMPEVAGDAALLVDPYSVDSISQAMITLHSSAELRSAYIERGLKRAKEFSWDITAMNMWQTIEKTFPAC